MPDFINPITKSEQPDRNRVVAVGVLASGTGTNFSALLRSDILPAKICAFATDQPQCGARTTAESHRIPTFFQEIAKNGRRQFEAQVIEHFLAQGVEVVALCGYMRLVSPSLLEAFPGGVLNIHPSLLPAFPGLSAQAQALAHGVKIAGCTIHIVDAGMDTGPILAQASVPVLPEDDETTLGLRILAEEHKLYGPTLAAWCRGEYVRVGRRMIHRIPPELSTSEAFIP